MSASDQQLLDAVAECLRDSGPPGADPLAVFAALGERLTELRAEVERLMDLADQNGLDAVEQYQRAEAAEARLAELRAENERLRAHPIGADEWDAEIAHTRAEAAEKRLAQATRIATEMLESGLPAESEIEEAFQDIADLAAPHPTETHAARWAAGLETHEGEDDA